MCRWLPASWWDAANKWVSASNPVQSGTAQGDEPSAATNTVPIPRTSKKTQQHQRGIWVKRPPAPTLRPWQHPTPSLPFCHQWKQLARCCLRLRFLWLAAAEVANWSWTLAVLCELVVRVKLVGRVTELAWESRSGYDKSTAFATLYIS